MNTDLAVLATTFGTFAIYLVVHTVVFRRIRKEEVVKWLMYVWMISVVFVFVLPVFFIVFLSSSYFEVAIVSFFLFSFLAFLYVIGVFGIIESSMRIRLLGEVAARGKKGIEKKELLRLYSKDVIIGKRLARFIASGEVVLRNGYYYPVQKFSFFSFHDTVMNIFRGVYGE